MDFLKGNLLDMAENGDFDVIVHGCNCFHAMRSGIARQIAERYPKVQEADSSTEKGSKKKLGDFSYAWVSNEGSSGFFVVNAYTQYKWSGVKDVFEYEAFDSFLNRLSGFTCAMHENLGRTIEVGFPMIGCGLARGDERRIMGSVKRFSETVRPWGKVRVVSLDRS